MAVLLTGTKIHWYMHKTSCIHALEYYSTHTCNPNILSLQQKDSKFEVSQNNIEGYPVSKVRGRGFQHVNETLVR